MDNEIPAGRSSVQTGLAIVNSEGHIWCDVLFQNQADACRYFVRPWKGDLTAMRGFRLVSASQSIEILQTRSQPSYLSAPLSEVAEPV
jgi:hypothetical protein